MERKQNKTKWNKKNFENKIAKIATPSKYLFALSIILINDRDRVYARFNAVMS